MQLSSIGLGWRSIYQRDRSGTNCSQLTMNLLSTSGSLIDLRLLLIAGLSSLASAGSFSQVSLLSTQAGWDTGTVRTNCQPDTLQESLKDCNPERFGNILVLPKIALTLPVTGRVRAIFIPIHSTKSLSSSGIWPKPDVHMLCVAEDKTVWQYSYYARHQKRSFSCCTTSSRNGILNLRR